LEEHLKYSSNSSKCQDNILQNQDELGIVFKENKSKLPFLKTVGFTKYVGGDGTSSIL